MLPITGSVDVKFTIGPGEGNEATTSNAVGDLQNFLVDDSSQGVEINGQALPMAQGSLKTTSVERLNDESEKEQVTGLPLTTKIVLAVVFGLIGVAIIIAIIVICMR